MGDLSTNPDGVDRTRRLGLAKKLLFALVLVLAPLALVEAGARLFLGDPPDSSLMIPGEGGEDSLGKWKTSELHTRDPYLIWRNRAGIDVLYKGARVRTNRFGMRDDPIPHRKPPGEYRILSLGESTTFGSKVDQDENYSALLERCLNERRHDATYQVLNAGAPAWTLAQSLVYLEREGLGFEPDAILVYHGYNDFLPSAAWRGSDAGREGPRTDREILDEQAREASSPAGWLLRHSTAIRWLAHEAMRASGRGSAGEVSRSLTSDTVRVPEEDRLACLRRMRDLAAERSIALVILVPCYREFDAHRELLLEFGRANGVRVIDLEEAIASLGGDRKALFIDGSHPKAPVHAAFARLICDVFVDEILPPEPGATPGD